MIRIYFGFGAAKRVGHGGESDGENSGNFRREFSPRLPAGKIPGKSSQRRRVCQMSWFLTEPIRFALGVKSRKPFRSYPLPGWFSNAPTIDTVLGTCVPSAIFAPTLTTNARDHLFEFVSEARTSHRGSGRIVAQSGLVKSLWNHSYNVTK